MTPNSAKSNGTLIYVLSSLFLTAAGLFYIFSAARIENPGSDTAIYLELAKNLLSDREYTFNFEPHTIYPPGFPSLLALVMVLGGDVYPLLTKFNAFAGFIGILSSFLLLSMEKSHKYALSITALVICSPLCYFWCTSGLSSDGLYFAVTMLILIALRLYLRSERTTSRCFFWLAVVMLCGYVVWVRSIGVSIVCALLAWIVFSLLRRKQYRPEDYKKRMAVAIPAVILSILMLGGWTIWAQRNKAPDHTNYFMGSYFSQLAKKSPQELDSGDIGIKDAPARIIDMTGKRVANLIVKITGAGYIKPSIVHYPVFWVTACILAGLLISLSRDDGLVPWYVLTYVGVIILWPFNENGRFLFPIFPFLLNYLVGGACFLWSFFKERITGKQRIIVSCGLAVLFAVNMFAVASSGKLGVQDIGSLGLWAVTIAMIAFGGRLMEVLSKWRKKPRLAIVMRYGTLALLGIVFAGILANGGYKISSLAAYNMSESREKVLQLESVLAADWVSENTDENQVIMGQHYAILHRLTKRKTYRFPLTTDIESIGNAIRIHGIDYVVVLSRKRYEYFTPSVEERFEKVKMRYRDAFSLKQSLSVGNIYYVDRAKLSNL